MRRRSALPVPARAMPAAVFAVALGILLPWAHAQSPSGTDAPAVSAAAKSTKPAEARSAAEDLRPRFELHVPSVAQAVRQVRDSRGGWFVHQLTRLYLAQAEENADGMRPSDMLTVASQVESWPDTAVSLLVFAPDVRGRVRWAVAVDWRADELRARLEKILKLPATRQLVEGLRLVSEKDAAPRIMLGSEALAHCVARGSGKSALASHADLPVPAASSTALDTGQSEGRPLLAARWNWVATEADSGATFLSSFSAITDVTYTGRIGDDGDWVEQFEVHWPALSGMGAKAFFGRVKQTFFVPDAAFGAVAFNATLAPGAMESLVGFGPQMIVDGPGQMEYIAEPGLGPIVSSVETEICITVLPGGGFLPAPDIVVQARARQADKVVEKLRNETERINKIHRERDRAEPWHVDTVLGRPVFWSDGGGNMPGMFVPLVMRPVVFISEDRDASGKERTFLVMGWTSTSPADFARRWLQLPRLKRHVYVPAERKTDGQAWLNWEVLYKNVVPYVNVAMGAVVPGMMLPPLDQAAGKLSESRLTAELSYGGLTVAHDGPVPLGGLVLPTMASIAAAPDESGGSDLARERLAVQRLEVFYHHAKLFKKDLNRWPAEVAELDGYIDFAGHPELLRLDLSSRKAWRDWFTGVFESKKDDGEEDEVEEGTPKLETKLYRIEWGREQWRLGLAAGTLEHLERLDIDQDGVIHRVEKSPPSQDPTTEKPAGPIKGEASADPPPKPIAEKVTRQAIKNVARRYREK